MCGGVTNVQFALLSSISFQGSVPVDPDKLITQKIIRATEKQEPQIINGYSSLNEFIEAVKRKQGRNPVTEAVIDIQSRLQMSNVNLSTGTVISSYSVRPQNQRSTPFQWSGIPNAIEQAALLARQVDAKHPSKIVISNADSKGIAHAVTVVGYIQSEGESQPLKC